MQWYSYDTNESTESPEWTFGYEWNFIRGELYGSSSGGASGTYCGFIRSAVKTAEAGICGAGFLGLARLGVLLDTLGEIGSGIRIRHVYLAALLKMAGITYIAEFTSGICKDAGYSAVGNQVEMVGKLAILAVSAPVVLALVETLKVFME